MIEEIRTSIISLKNLEQQLSYSIADINKRNEDLIKREADVTQAFREHSDLIKENENLKAQIAELNLQITKLKENDNKESKGTDPE